MDKAKRELLMNICLISPVLSVLYGIMVTGIDNSLVSHILLSIAGKAACYL
ncbi:hypothetical protein [Paenibacillus sp. FSL E2-0178]|uniref:hypothetical protein n=1 Tax=Paenibacillus sp. FSL E2-0178 TaxID=2921361 RepID=UPI0031597681